MALRLSGARLLASALRSAQQQASTTTAASTAGRRAFSVEGTFGDKERAEEVRRTRWNLADAHRPRSSPFLNPKRASAHFRPQLWLLVSPRRALENTRVSRFAQVESRKKLSLRRTETVFLLARFVLSASSLRAMSLFSHPSTPKPPLPPKRENKKYPQRIHFRKEDERLLRKLLAKVKAQADTVSRGERWGGEGLGSL